MGVSKARKNVIPFSQRQLFCVLNQHQKKFSRAVITSINIEFHGLESTYVWLICSTELCAIYSPNLYH